MRRPKARLVVATFVLACSTLVAPLAAHADSSATSTVADTSQPAGSVGWLSAESTFVAHRHTIRVTYRKVVNTARTSFVAAMSHAHTGRARATARAGLASALTNAEVVEQAALAALGDGPAISNGLDNAELQRERAAINQDYADEVDADVAAYRAEVAAAASSADLVTARANLRLAIAVATIARSAALVNLGVHAPKSNKHSSVQSPRPAKN